MFELDEEFHRTIFKRCKKEKTWLVIQQMNVHFNRSRMLRLVTDYNWDNIFSQHVNIFKAIQDQDANKAEKIIQQSIIFPDFFTNPVSPIILLIDSISFQGAQFLL